MRQFFMAVIAALLLSACGSNQQNGDNNKSANGPEILGAGATFPYPLYSKMFDVYHNESGVKVNYQSIGSGGGIKQLQEKTVDFGASDAPMSDEQLGKSPSAIVHVPTCLGAVVITYNLPGVTDTLKFTPDVLADIYLGKITKWNDARIAKTNAGVKLPDLPIAVVHRSDGSGTSYVFTDYLSKVSSEWNGKVGKKTSVDWPTGLGAKGNEGVTGMVKQTPGGIGYVELVYALQNNLPVVALQNKAGNYVPASLNSVTAAANVDLPADMRVSITNTDAPDGYPISSFTYILLYANQSASQKDSVKAAQVVKLVNWMVHDGQKYTQPLNYAPLPASAVTRAEAILKSVNFDAKPLI
ncbi:MAG TPA: phosphate ABC transporter substrate-binding protein PstS [Chitinophagales bacterium]|nr:phosphate ABC transporter substrate-binding protein PstS [Chitinophagales bacterium]